MVECDVAKLSTAVGATSRRSRSTVESTRTGAGRTQRAEFVVPSGGTVASGPLAGLSDGHRLVLAVLRGRLAGASAARVALDSGLSSAHTRRCLCRLRDEGFVESSFETVMWGYSTRRVQMWRLQMNEMTIGTLPQIGWITPPEPDRSPPVVPPEFWYLFWSGECASQLRLPDDAVHVADTLISGPDEAARTWALEFLPVSALRQLRDMRGYENGVLADRIDTALRQRSMRDER